MITREAIATTVAPSSPPIPGQWKVGEEYHSLLRSLPWPAANPADIQLSAIGFTSCLPREGVTTFALQSALAAAASGVHQILVVDANLSRPRIGKALGLSGQQGLADILAGGCNAADAIQQTKYTNLSALTVGSAEQDPATLFGIPERAHQLVEVLSHGFDLVIFDLPPIAKSSVVMPLLSQLDGLVMIVESEKIPWQTARQARQRLARADVNLLGAVVNKKRNDLPRLLSRLLFSS
jgi:protein-tyrosine kinase